MTQASDGSLSIRLGTDRQTAVLTLSSGAEITIRPDQSGLVLLMRSLFIASNKAAGKPAGQSIPATYAIERITQYSRTGKVVVPLKDLED